MTASWWNNPDQGDDKPVIRHSVDPNSYCYPDDRHAGLVGGNFVTIPAARGRSDGRSRGFDSDSAGVVHVDPQAPDGGAVVDLSTLGAAEMDRAVAESVYPHEAFYKLAGPAPAIDRYHAPREAAINPRLPGTYTTPRAAQGGLQADARPAFAGGTVNLPDGNPPAVTAPANLQFAQQPPPTYQPPTQQAPPSSPYPHAAGAIPAPNGAAPPFNAPAPAYYPGYGAPPNGQYQPYMPPPQFLPMAQDPQVQGMLSSLAQSVQDLARRMDRVPAAAPPQARPLPAAASIPVGVPPRRAQPAADDFDEDPKPIPRRTPREEPQEPPQKQTLRDYRQATVGPEPEQLIAGFETLKIDFVSGPRAEKARKRVFFDYGPMGKQSSQFHGVYEEKNCLVLVYDTRYEDGTQYLPAESNDPITVNVPSLNGRDFRVMSAGIVHGFGVFDFVILLKNDAGAEEK